MQSFKRTALSSMAMLSGATLVAVGSMVAGCGSDGTTTTVTSTQTVTSTAAGGGTVTATATVTASASGSTTTGASSTSSTSASTSSSASDGGSDASDAGSDADAAPPPPCVTTAAALALAAGSDAGVTPSLLFGFDPGTEFSNLGHWAYAGGSTGAMDFSTEGHTCPGSLAATTNFAGNQYPTLQQFLFNSAQNWTGFTKIHF